MAVVDESELDKELESLTNMEIYTKWQNEHHQQDEAMAQRPRDETIGKLKKRGYNTHSDDLKSLESGQQNEPEDKKNNPGPKSRLGDEHKRHVIEFIDNHPSAVVDQAIDSLTKQFEGLVIKKTAVHDFMKAKCNISLKKAHFHPLARNSKETINKRYEWGAPMDEQ
ncbi:hypothetical protein DFQ28_004015 [Apophysomyces sp. BC1034]|nr:hypothetical protein DFQ30_005420 [Apophysomyces sp. BC1015]KAG0178850.1 hypothetical protein DFQ29_002918 [Apophysomyces sp. BC1021]KAG0189020.1 hypothetical protein DFQ28_004015 [Apophysomyces sp. BC1034]